MLVILTENERWKDRADKKIRMVVIFNTVCFRYVRTEAVWK